MNEQNHVPTILAVSCQKGGEGKTTSAWHIGAALTQRGYKVCLIDCDPDHHLSFALGWQDDERATLTNLVLMAIVMGQFPDADAISATIRRHDEGYDYIPCTKKLADANLFLASMPNNETYLRHILRDTTAFADYHYVILDGLPGDNDPARKRFYWNSRDLEGDIVDLYGYLNNCDFDTAIRALRAMLPARTHQASRPSTSAILRPGVTKSAPFSPPKPAPQNLKYVYAYLINTRSISPTVVKWLVKQHYIYADAKRNLCYISPGYGTDRPYVGQKGTWVDSETGKPTHFRCAVEGGNFEGRFSVNMVRADGSPTCVQRVFVCEAAVDLFSIMSFLELNQRDFTQYGYISLECCYESPLNYHLRHHPETKTLYLGQDNDLGGAQSRAACRVLLQQQNWPGRVVDKIPCTPSGDWNDDLRAFCSSAHPSKTTSPVIPSKGGEKR